MAKNKNLDQLSLLFVGVVMILGMLWLINFMENRGVPERIGFFILANAMTCFILIWNGVVWFGRTPRFWLFQGLWIVVHAAIATAWAYSASWVELCVVALPLEGYVHFKIGTRRLRLAAESN